MQENKKIFHQTWLYMSDDDFDQIVEDVQDVYDNELDDYDARQKAHEWIQDDFDILMVSIENKNFDCTFVVDANLGLWYGNVEASAEFDSLEDAIWACIRDAYDFRIYEDSNGDLNIESAHHDGRNYFIVRRVDDYDTDLDLREVKPLHLWTELYGG